MGSAALEILGLVLCLVGWVGLILACGLPMWQVTAFLDHNIVTAQTTWKGLWMSCVVQSTGHMQCKVYESVLALSTEVQAARALTVSAVLLALVALFVSLAGAQCTTCVAPGPAKARVALTGGVLYALCGLLALVPLCWFANIVVREFYDPAVPVSQKYELGAALYIGWAASALLMCGGGLVCCGAWVCAGRPDLSFPVKYSAPRRPTASGDYDKKMTTTRRTTSEGTRYSGVPPSSQASERKDQTEAQRTDGSSLGLSRAQIVEHPALRTDRTCQGLNPVLCDLHQPSSGPRPVLNRRRVLVRTL
uniref:Claudin 5 n=1 Tax=Spermophilus dauricus TaxID=99837 RepID=A0A8C9PQ72_SPEDA